jgi:hypothetical protein
MTQNSRHHHLHVLLSFSVFSRKLIRYIQQPVQSENTLHPAVDRDEFAGVEGKPILTVAYQSAIINAILKLPSSFGVNKTGNLYIRSVG